MAGSDYHRPVLLDESIEALALRPGSRVVDGTIGGGGHAEAILRAIAPSGRLIGFDVDEEALANAILRGNRESLDKWVDVRAELHEDVIRVHVTDEGPGFDPESVPEPIRPEQLDEAGGRGLFLIRKLVDAVQFNEQGNSICMILRRH